nr:MAG TPA: hypothetical protein [Caudoviricetes sp.]
MVSGKGMKNNMKEFLCIAEVMSLGEAAERWGILPITLNRWCAGSKNQLPRFYRHECRKSGKYWLITRAGMERVAGPEPNKDSKDLSIDDKLYDALTAMYKILVEWKRHPDSIDWTVKALEGMNKLREEFGVEFNDPELYKKWKERQDAKSTLTKSTPQK